MNKIIKNTMFKVKNQKVNFYYTALHIATKQPDF